MHLRRALPTEAPLLSQIALRSKAHWGYDTPFMQRFAAELGVTPELLAPGRSATFVAEIDGVPRGFYVLSLEAGRPTLRDLWIDPPAMGRGAGAALFAHMLGEARTLGYRTVRIESDPNAEGFYARMGARRIGDVSSTIVAGRVLPLMEIDP